ncbi:MAG: N-acetyltransferase [Candidatus Zixiibacteriota bacterium]|nr:MAG: N-acetyltransferase [candidate division Zixibacteria bacterium]
MYRHLSTVTLKTGEIVDLCLIQGPDPEWAPRLERMLGHKGELWKWQNHETLTADLGMEARYYVLHRDGRPFANVMTVERDGVGILGHVWTDPDDRRRGAASVILQIQMEDFRQRGGRALYLGTDYDQPPYHIYGGFGFRGVEPGSRYMEYHPASRDTFQDTYFAPGEVEIEDLAWRHWPLSPPLFLGDFPGRVRLAAVGLVGRISPEGPLLNLLRVELRRDEALPRRVRVLVRRDGGAVVGVAGWTEHPLWPDTLLVDLYCHPRFWSRAGELLSRLALSDGPRRVTYSDSPDKDAALQAAGFVPAATLPHWIPQPAAPSTDVKIWVRA